MQSRSGKPVKIKILQYGWAILGTMAVLGILLFGIYAEKLMQHGKVELLSVEELERLLRDHKEDKSLLATGEVYLTLNGYKLPYDREGNVWYVAQNLMKRDWEGVLDTGPDGVQLYVVRDGYLERKEESIREGHVFQAVLVKGTAYALTNVVATGMPIISIDTESSWQPEYTQEDIDNYVYNSEPRYLGRITVFDADGNSGTYGGTGRAGKSYRIIQDEISYHERGASSSGFQKKGYALKLLDQQGEKKKENLFGLGYSAKWKLVTGEEDETKLREKTAWQLWCEIADRQTAVSEQASAMEYCEVVLDGKYMGMYFILKALDQDTLNLSGTDVLYKVLQVDVPTEEDIQKSIANNYMVCYPIRMRYPEKGVGNPAENWEPIRQYLSAARWSADFEKLYSLIEEENIIDYYIFLEATAAADNAVKNTYRVARRTTDGGVKLITLPWDLNFTFGAIYIDQIGAGYDGDVTPIYTDAYIQQLFINNVHGEKDRLKETWMRYRQDILSDGHVLGLIQENMEYMLDSGAFARESERWPDAGNDSDLSEILRFEKERLAFLDGYFGNF